MKKISWILAIFGVFFISGLSKAQLTTYPMLSVGYVYQNQSFGEIGGKLLFLKSDDVIYRLGASALMGATHSEFAIMPKVQADVLINFERNVDIEHSYYFLGGFEVTNKYLAPKIGISLFGMVDLTGGYAFSIGNSLLKGKEMKGLNINFTLNIPTVAIHDKAK